MNGVDHDDDDNIDRYDDDDDSGAPILRFMKSVESRAANR